MKTFSAIAAAALLVLHAGAVEVADLSRDGWDIKVDATPAAVDPGRDFMVRVTVKGPPGVEFSLPDLRDRFGGFSVAEDFEEPLAMDSDGRFCNESRWRLVPEPCARRYRLAPFVIGDFHTAAVTFASPADREPVTGDYEVNPRRDLPPLSWKLVGIVAGALALVALVVVCLLLVIKAIAAKVREIKMSPIQRAMVELDRLLRKGLPGRGRYKDFYVELTMVVRRYVQRKYGIRAPNMTTEEFLHELAQSGRQNADQSKTLTEFLESADLVKFAGLEATPEMADAATGKARGYLETDNSLQSQPASNPKH